MTDKIKQFTNPTNTDNIKLSELFDISDLSRQVGENTSDIKKLKEQSEKLESVKVEMIEVKSRQANIEEKLELLNVNDGKIEQGINSINSGTTTFRYWLGGAVVIIFTCIFGTLMFGLNITKSNQSTMQIYLEDKIEASDKKHDKNYDNISVKIDKITDLLIEAKTSK